MTQANSQPDQDMTEAIGQPRTAMNAPLSSNAVAAMAAPRTPSRMTRPRTYIPVPPTTKGDQDLDGEVEPDREPGSRRAPGG